MRPAPAILLAALTAATLVPSGQPAAASCAAPYLTDVDPMVLRPGTSIEIDGVGFANGCQDTGSCSGTLGCTSCDYGREPSPMTGIKLVLRQHGRSWPLGTADATTSGAVTWTVDIPTNVKIGRAILVPANGEATTVRVRPR